MIQKDLTVLRSLESARKRIVIAGPSLSSPLSAYGKNALRARISEAIGKGVNVYVFLANPVLEFSKSPSETISRIKADFPSTNTDDVLGSLRTFYTELSTIFADATEMLHVLLVNKASLDFAVICDDATVLCRSTIHWSPQATDQKELGRHPEHDYKPPIVEAQPTDTLKDSFYAEYRNYLENLMFAAGFSAAAPDNPGLVRRLFEVQNVSPALRI